MSHLEMNWRFWHESWRYALLCNGGLDAQAMYCMGGEL